MVGLLAKEQRIPFGTKCDALVNASRDGRNGVVKALGDNIPDCSGEILTKATAASANASMHALLLSMLDNISGTS